MAFVQLHGRPSAIASQKSSKCCPSQVEVPIDRNGGVVTNRLPEREFERVFAGFRMLMLRLCLVYSVIEEGLDHQPGPSVNPG